MRFLTITMAALLLFITGCNGVDQGEGPTTPTATRRSPDGDVTPTVPDDEQTPTPTETKPTDEPEDIAVVLDADGRLAVLDAATGEQIRELLDGVRVDDPASNDIAVSPDMGDVYVVVPPDEPPGESELMRVPVDGGEPQVITRGSTPAVSPDGDTLAYVSFEERTDTERAGVPEPVLVLRNLDSGEETRLSREQPFYFIPDVAWTTDGTQVAFSAGEIRTGLYVVDRDAGSLEEARRLGPELTEDSDEMSWGPMAAFGEDGLAVVETCCGVPPEERWHVAAVAVADGTDHGSLLPGERIEATHLDSDADASRLLIVVRGGPDGGQLMRWDGQGDPEQIADGVIVAAW